ncbi:MAG: glycosyltransferase family 2 protein [Cytophagales bacterium]|nr:glycosyltransferase family 2 protein [Cytophagales bacterium]
MSTYPLKFSIVIPTYNAAPVIENCLKSIEKQTYKEVECIIVDGCSKDDTMKIVQAYQKSFPHIQSISEKDYGIYDAMNKGISMCTGDYVLFLGSDDLLCSDDVLIAVNEHIIQNNKPDIIYGNVYNKHEKSIYYGEMNAEKLLKSNFPHQAMFYKRDIFRSKKYNLKYPILADYHLNIVLYTTANIKFSYIDKIITIYNDHGTSYRTIDFEFLTDKPTIVYHSQLLRKNDTKFAGFIDNMMLEYIYWIRLGKYYHAWKATLYNLKYSTSLITHIHRLIYWSIKLKYG